MKHDRNIELANFLRRNPEHWLHYINQEDEYVIVGRDTKYPIHKWKTAGGKTYSHDTLTWIGGHANTGFKISQNLGRIIPRGQTVIDIDERHNGRVTWADVMKRCSLKMRHVSVVTPDGCHIYYNTGPHRFRVGQDALPGIDIKQSGFTIMPGSYYGSRGDRRYEAGNGWGMVEDMPEILVDYLNGLSSRQGATDHSDAEVLDLLKRNIGRIPDGRHKSYEIGMRIGMMPCGRGGQPPPVIYSGAEIQQLADAMRKCGFRRAGGAWELPES